MTRRRAWLENVLALVAVVLVWEVIARLVNARFPVVPAPSAIGAAAAQAGQPIWLNLRLTLIEASIGLVAGSAAGLLLAVAFVAWPRMEATLYNLVVTIHSVPLVAVAPILLVMPLLQTSLVFRLLFAMWLSPEHEVFGPLVLAGVAMSISGALLVAVDTNLILHLLAAPETIAQVLRTRI